MKSIKKYYISPVVIILIGLLLPASVAFAKSYSLVINGTDYTNNGMTITISGFVNVIDFVGQEDDQWVRVNWGDGVTDVFQAMNLPNYVKTGGDFTVDPFSQQHTYLSLGARTLIVKVYHSTQQGNDSSGNVDAGTVTIDTENTLIRCTDGSDNDHDSLTDFADPDCAAFVPPVLDPVGNKSVDELALLTFTATASDPTNDPLTFSLSGAPAGAAITSGGDFSWTPTEAQGPGSYPFTVVVTDNSGNIDFEIIIVAVDEVNTDPVLDAIGNQSVNENALLQFTVSATDSDLPAQTLTYTATNLPVGASFNPTTRTFSWTPTFSDAAASPYTAVHFEVSDATALIDSEDIDITVNDVNRAPILDPIGNQTGSESTLLSFTVTASDPDGDTVTLSATGLPAGATFDTNTGDFSWTPTIAQAGNYSVTFTVSDGSLTDEEVVPIDIGNVNQTPSLDPIGDSTIDEEALFAFTATATDADVGDTLTYSLAGEPSGASITSGGDFSWTPTEAQGPGSYTFDVIVSDGTTSDSETATLNVQEINVAPIAVDDADTTPEDTQLVISLATLLANDTDADDPANTLTILSVGNAASSSVSISGTDVLFGPAPDFNGTATFEYTLSDGVLTDIGLVSVDVTAVNDAPTIALVGTDPHTVAQDSTFVDPGATGSDIEDGVLIPVVTGTVNTALAGEYELTYTATDIGGLFASITRTVVVTATPIVNPPPSSGGGGSNSGSCGAGFTFDRSTLKCVPVTPPTPPGQVLGASTSTPQALGVTCGLYMNQHLRRGSPKNDSGQVMRLQQFLNKGGYGTFAPTGFFGPLTFAAVKNFQKAYADQILKPWNISSPTGLVYLTTIRQLNLNECPALMATLPMPELVPWNLNPNAQ